MVNFVFNEQDPLTPNSFVEDLWLDKMPYVPRSGTNNLNRDQWPYINVADLQTGGINTCKYDDEEHATSCQISA